jgi:hypothetical protein
MSRHERDLTIEEVREELARMGIETDTPRIMGKLLRSLGAACAKLASANKRIKELQKHIADLSARLAAKEDDK